MCLFSWIGCNQLASSAMNPPFSITTRELVATHSATSCPSTYQSPQEGSTWDALVMISASIRLRRESCISSSHLVVTALALRFTNVVTTRTQPQTNKCPVNFPHREKMLRRVCTLGAVGSSPSRCHCSRPCSSQMWKLNPRAPFLSRSGSLLVNPNRSKCAFTRAALADEYIVDVWRGGAVDDVILSDHGLFSWLHDLRCHVQPKSPAVKAIYLPLNFYRLEWP